jgi:hypothetical protein
MRSDVASGVEDDPMVACAPDTDAKPTEIAGSLSDSSGTRASSNSLSSSPPDAATRRSPRSASEDRKYNRSSDVLSKAIAVSIEAVQTVDGALLKAKQVTSDVVLKSKEAILNVDVVEVAVLAKDAAKGAAVAVVNDLTSGEEKQTNEVANHYLDKMKYGLAESDGTKLSNYYRYHRNHHEYLSLCFADKRNPYNRTSRLFILWNTLSLQFCLACLFSKSLRFDVLESIYIALIMVPYSALINSLASCGYFRRKNTCIKWSRRVGFAILGLLSLVAAGYLTIGLLYVAQNDINARRLFQNFFVSLFMDSLMPFYFGVLNWILPSWQGVLCCPQVHINCFGYNKTTPRWYPLLGYWPIKVALKAVFLDESTYEEDKEKFLQLYPDRIAIDVYAPVVGVVRSPLDASAPDALDMVELGKGVAHVETDEEASHHDE